MKKYLVTGGAGFIGVNLVKSLLVQGHSVRVIDNLATGSLCNVMPFLNDIEFIEGDIRDLQTLSRIMKSIDVVLHQAALPSVPRSIVDPLASNDVNVTGSLNVLVAARDAGVRRVVIASSSSVYGDSSLLPKTETMPANPLSPYAVSKLAVEQYCHIFTQIYGLPTVVLRYFNVFGPHQDPNSQYSAVIPKFIMMMLRGEPPLIHGNGHQTRDFTYVDNVVSANLLASETDHDISGCFNVASGERVSLLQLVAKLNQIVGTSLSPEHKEIRTGDVEHSQGNIDKICMGLGYEPKVKFDEGLRQTVDFFRTSVFEAKFHD